MTPIGTRIDETGTLILDGGNFHLRRDAGGRYQLESKMAWRAVQDVIAALPTRRLKLLRRRT